MSKSLPARLEQGKPSMASSPPHRSSSALGKDFESTEDEGDMPKVGFSKGSRAPLLDGKGGDYGSINNIDGGDSDISQSLLTSLLANSLPSSQKYRASLENNPNKSLSNSLLATLAEKLASDRGATVILACWNILPLLQGSAVYSMPYSVVQGGYSVVIVIAIMSLMADTTGNILTDCLYDVSPRSKTRKRVRMDYVDIARTVWGNHGARLLHVILNFYLFTGDVVNVLLIGKSVFDLLHPYTTLSFTVMTIIFSIPCYPTLFITRLTILAYLSMLSVFSIIVGIIAIIVVFISKNDVWAANASQIPFIDIQGFPLAVSIVMFSCLTHSVLPQIEGNMKEPEKVSRAIHISYISSCLLKCIVSVMGALTYGHATLSIVTLNTGVDSFAAKVVCTVALTGFGIFNYPLNMFVCCETTDILVEGTRFSKDGPLWPLWLGTTRLILTVGSVVIALIVPYFGILLAIRGSMIGTCLIFVFPCYFHMKLKWNSLTRFQIATDIFLIVIGTLVGSAGLYVSCGRLVQAIRFGGET